MNLFPAIIIFVVASIVLVIAIIVFRRYRYFRTLEAKKRMVEKMMAQNHKEMVAKLKPEDQNLLDQLEKSLYSEFQLIKRKDGRKQLTEALKNLKYKVEFAENKLPIYTYEPTNEPTKTFYNVDLAKKLL